MPKKLKDKFNPKDFENEIYANWEEKGYFKPSMDTAKEPFCIMMPPPNVTGKLHMGHALDGTIQDILIRYKRMCGFNTLWVPGTDHASISTEMKVVQKLKEEGISKQDIGRNAFIKEAWDWTHLYGEEIQKQQRKLGCSCDWSKKRFTLDDGLSDAVLDQFIRLYNDGLIYKGTRMVNWCTNCNTSVSDVEVEYHEEEGFLWHIKYPIKNSNKFLTVATTRPETLLGDTAVAVHPDDERYTDIVGGKCILPLVDREIPIVADSFVEKDFGTGVVKITPAHDVNDYECGIRNNLKILNVFTDDFHIGNIAPKYTGLTINDARKLIVSDLKDLGLLLKEEKYIHNVSKCERCKSTIEPKISTQWFVKMDQLAKPALDIVKNDDVKFIPKRYEKTYFNWMENIKDWCISRQLWWGHRIPAYYCKDCGHIHVAKEQPFNCSKCSSKNIIQDEDTLDTWFSSALWPFSTLGWPNTDDELFKTFYPTNVLVTGYDIIFFWVARMIFSGLYSLKQKPFSDVLIHGIVRDQQGRKMSKSLGNGIDPLEIIDKYGADSLRFAVLSGTTMGNDVKFSPDKLEQASNFSNKIWNAAKFINMNVTDENKIIALYNKISKDGKLDFSSFKLEDKWIINKLNNLTTDITKNIDNYDLGIAVDKIYSFIWDDFCNWYIELVKLRIDSDMAILTLDYVLKICLQLLHPFMPFVTTEIYDSLIDFNKKDLIVSKWPTFNESNVFPESLAIDNFMQIIVEIRNIRNEKHIHPSKKSKLIIYSTKYANAISESQDFLLKLCFADELTIVDDKNSFPKNSINIISNDIEVFIPTEGLINFEEEQNRLLDERKKLESEVLRCEKMLSNPGFVSKAPESKIDEEKKKLQGYKDRLSKVIDLLN